MVLVLGNTSAGDFLLLIMMSSDPSSEREFWDVSYFMFEFCQPANTFHKVNIHICFFKSWLCQLVQCRAESYVLVHFLNFPYNLSTDYLMGNIVWWFGGVIQAICRCINSLPRIHFYALIHGMCGEQHWLTDFFTCHYLLSFQRTRVCCV